MGWLFGENLWYRLLWDWDNMRWVALDYAVVWNNGINGCIGAINGWIVKIRNLSCTKDLFNLSNPKSYYSCNRCCGINVQAIDDQKKHIIDCDINSHGAEHDLTAFKQSSGFYKWLVSKWERLTNKRFYFIGHSAYAIKSFLITPLDNAVHGTADGNFYFFHTSSWICVECAFGKIDLQWKMLWKPLSFHLKYNVNIFDACMRLHHFIIDWWERVYWESTSNVDERKIFLEDHRKFMATFPDQETGGVHGGNEEEVCHHDSPTNHFRDIPDFGHRIWQTLCDHFIE